MNVWAVDPGNLEGGQNVVDNRYSIDGSMGTRTGEQLHHGWVHPCFSRARAYRVRDQSLPGTKHRVNELRAIHMP